MVADIVLAAVIAGLLVGLLLLRRYLATEAFRRGDLRQASLGLLMAIGPFFGVHPKPPEPEPTAVLTPKGDDEGDPGLEALGVEVHDARDDYPDATDRSDDTGGHRP